MAGANAKQGKRRSPWRQASILTQEAAEHFGLTDRDGPQTRVVVISHDCDLVNDCSREPFVEVIAGTLIDKVGGNAAWGKSSRTLHYTVACTTGEECIALVATNKARIEKQRLEQFAPDDRYSVSRECLVTLRNWLAARYRRPAFPNTFNNRMSATGAGKALAKLLEKHGTEISFVFFDLHGARTVEYDDGHSYELTVVLAFPPGESPDIAADVADTVAEAVEEALRAKLRQDSGIVLQTCLAISEDDITVKQAKMLDLFDLDYLSLRHGNMNVGQPLD